MTAADMALALASGGHPPQHCHITIVRNAGEASQSFVLQPGRVLRVGRAESNEIVLKVAGVTSHHAELFLRTPEVQDPDNKGAQQLCIRDTSRNGTGVRPPPPPEGSTVEPTPGLDNLGWERLAKGAVRDLADGWQLKLPLRSRSGDNQLAETVRTLSLQVRFVAAPQPPPVQVVPPAPVGDEKKNKVRKRKKDKGQEAEGAEAKKGKKEKRVKKPKGPELLPGGVVPIVPGAPHAEVGLVPTDKSQVAAATPPVGAELSGTQGLLGTDRPLGRKEQWERKRRERLERERAAGVVGGATAPATERPTGEAAGADRAPSEHSAGTLVPEDLSELSDGDGAGSPPRTAEGNAAGGSKASGTRPKQRPRARPSGDVAAQGGPAVEGSSEAPGVKAGDGERVDSSPERAAQKLAAAPVAPSPALSPSVPGVVDNNAPVEGGVANSASVPHAATGPGGVRLTEAAVKAVATAAAAARGRRQEQEAAEAWRLPGLSVDRGGLVGHSVLRDMSISPISTPGVGRKKKRKKAGHNQSSSGEAGDAARAAAKKKKEKEKKKKKAEAQAAAVAAARGGRPGVAPLPHSVSQRLPAAFDDGYGRVDPKAEKPISPERWDPSPPAQSAPRAPTPPPRREASPRPMGAAMAHDAEARAAARAAKAAKAAAKEKDKARKAARDTQRSPQAVRKRSRSAGKQARKRSRQRRG